MGSLARAARRQQERAAWKTPQARVDDGRLVPPAGVPTWIWMDVLAEHTELVAQITAAANRGESADPKRLAKLGQVVNARMQTALGNAPDGSDDAMADRMQFVLERYAAFLESDDQAECQAFERTLPAQITSFVQGEGQEVMAKLRQRERHLRRQLPMM